MSKTRPGGNDAIYTHRTKGRFERSRDYLTKTKSSKEKTKKKNNKRQKTESKEKIIREERREKTQEFPI